MPEAPLPFEPLAAASTEWLPAAVIHHDTGSGCHHDLLLATRRPEGPDDRACATWRVASDPRTLAPGHAADVAAIAPHRALYLQLAGPRVLDRNRGIVSPTDTGQWRHAGGGRVEITWTSTGAATYALESAPATRIRRIER